MKTIEESLYVDTGVRLCQSKITSRIKKSGNETMVHNILRRTGRGARGRREGEERGGRGEGKSKDTGIRGGA